MINYCNESLNLSYQMHRGVRTCIKRQSQSCSMCSEMSCSCQVHATLTVPIVGLIRVVTRVSTPQDNRQYVSNYLP